MAPDMANALIQRQHLIESRVSALAEAALAQQEAWLKRLGTPPAGGRRLERWLQELRTVVAYRDRYAVDSSAVLGDARSDAQRLDHARAAQAIRRARTISDEACDLSPVVDPRIAVRERSR
ncbi:hypothetical protein AFL01nite_05470 [Aeromicrobium flavum]|uniref:Uncharacterized protein n=1 Tax=Aeromicrobium flavum TaxID=416568 RepID=A0A512HS55_9ACTN|nr:hypothetical protein AFL01nite_05470 [Aeromicrobium flavum]